MPQNKADTSPSPECVAFDKVVFREELEDIRARRDHLERAQAKASVGTEASFTKSEKILGPLSQTGAFTTKEPVLNAVGLSLSGGGIRSAAFCLGVLQALDNAEVLKRVDYLSTVSGGGYIGSSLSAGQTTDHGRFPFCRETDKSDTPSVKHIRDWSNYLMPHGAKDLIESLVIYVRGLVANAILVLPWLLFAAYITVRSHPTGAQLAKPSLFRLPIYNPFPYNHFVLTTYLLLALLLIFAIWTLIRSFRSQSQPEVPSRWTTFYVIAFAGATIVAFFELQPFILNRIWANKEWTLSVQDWLQNTAVVLAPLAGVAAFFARQLAALIKRALETPGSASKVMGYSAKAVVYFAAALMPLLLWIVYFQLSWWGIAECAAGVPAAVGAYAGNCGIVSQYPHTPSGLRWLAGALFGSLPYPMATFYLFCGGILLVVSLFLSPNANSLHRLYRDRLSKAFLFKPQSKATGDDLPALDVCKLTHLNPQLAPYQLINTALNIQGSRHVNQRGRNADFFMFSRRYVGSEATGYVSTEAMQNVVQELDLGTAMAVSGAAAASNMGAQSIKPLTPTLALLNVRVGFWVRNPRFIKVHKIKARLLEFFSLYFLYELIADLREDSWNVYVTDGGHVENLGAYELLKRRCRIVLVVDAEADPKMTFGSFVELQRYARIDLGVRINLAWETIAETTLRISKEMAESGKITAGSGPHCAIGRIDYPDGGHGVIVYIKSSLTGDESDYVLNYKKRYPLFPHESTADQFFSEEQFEVYRALGFHAASGLFDRHDCFGRLDPEQSPDTKDDLELLDKIFPTAPKVDPLWTRKAHTFVELADRSQQ
jgi:hypothetical protein